MGAGRACWTGFASTIQKKKKLSECNRMYHWDLTSTSLLVPVPRALYYRNFQANAQKTETTMYAFAFIITFCLVNLTGLATLKYKNSWALG